MTNYLQEGEATGEKMKCIACPKEIDVKKSRFVLCRLNLEKDHVGWIPLHDECFISMAKNYRPPVSGEPL